MVIEYKGELYAKYVSTHIAPRKNVGDIREFESRGIVYQDNFFRFMPTKLDSNILDLGCGNGSLLWWLSRNGYSRVWGIDISEEQIAVAKGLGVNCVEKADAIDYLKSRPATYDVIFLRDVLEHFSKQDIFTILRLCCVSLVPGGRLIIQTPNAESPFASRVRYGDFTHEVAFTSGSISQIARASGFGTVSCFPKRPVAKTLLSSLRAICWRILEIYYHLLLLIEVGRGPGRIFTQDLIAVALKDVQN